MTKGKRDGTCESQQQVVYRADEPPSEGIVMNNVLFRLLTLAVLITGCQPSPTLAVACPSPSQNLEARLLNYSRTMGDHNFRIEIGDPRTGDRQIVLERSPDEGGLDGRFIWSKDSRYLLLVGKKYFTAPTWKLDTGEVLYLLHDRQENVTKINSRQLRAKTVFSAEDLEGIEFTENVVVELEAQVSSIEDSGG